MVQGYYTLEEAAQILGMEADKLGQMAQRREIRAFADRGTWRFRTQDVEELGRQMGIGSDPELQMGERPSSKSSGKLPQVKAKKTTGGDDLFEFELSGSSEDLSIELDDPGAVRKKTNLAGGPGKDKKTNLSDEDDALRSPSVEDQPIGFLDDPGRSSNKLGRGKTGKGKTGTSDPDSGLKLVPMDDDGIPISQDFGGKDSDVKLDPAMNLGSDPGDLPPTEEVRLDDLDLELETPSSKKSSGKLGGPSSKAGLGSAASPFELSEDDLDLDASDTKKLTKVGGGGSGRKMTQSAPPPSDDDDEVSLGDLTLGDGDFSGASGASGINLHLPADTGINLERAAAGGDDDVEFELSLDGEGDDLVTGPATSKNLGSGAAAAETPSSESEFELTLGDDGDLAPLEEGAGSASSDSTEVAEEKDIFETDFDIPALDDESGSAAVALEESDTDLESSDFEFDATASEEDLEDSGSQVVAIDSEEEEEDSQSQVVAIDEEELVEEEDELAGITDGEEEEEEEEEELVAASSAALPPAPWGALPTIFMLPCVVVMGLLGLMTYEMLHGMWGYRQQHPTATLLIRPVSELFGADLPKD